jgi:spore germination protein KB
MKISHLQVLSLIALGSYGTAVFFLSEIIYVSGRTAWITPVFLELFILPCILLIMYISKDYEGLTIFEIIELITGKFISKLLCLIYIGINIIISIFNLALSTNITRSYMLHVTPLWIPLILTLIVATLIAGSGIEVIGRMCALLMPILISCFIIFLLIGYNNFDISNLRPFLDKGIMNVGNSFYLLNSLLSEVLLLLFIITAAIREKKQIIKHTFKYSFLLFIIIPMFIFVSYIGILSYEVVSKTAFGGLNVSMFAGVERYIQGTEVFVLIVILFMSILKLSTCLYCTGISFNQIFNNKIKNQYYIICFFSIIIFVSVFFFTNFNYVYKINLLFFQYIVIPFSLFIILFSFSIVTYKKVRNKGDRK